MTITLRYNASAASKLLDHRQFKRIESSILAARKKVLEEVELATSSSSIATSKQPLDAGFIDLPRQLLDEDANDSSHSLMAHIEGAAADLHQNVDQLVLLGIGGSYMGARALMEALCHPFHNELNRDERNGVPRLYFGGNNIDNDSINNLLHLLKRRCQDKSDVRQRWGIVVISKSGETLESAVAFRLFRRAFEEYYGFESVESRNLVVFITGDSGNLREFAAAAQHPVVLPIPDAVGGRFSVLTAVGLFPAAVLGIDVRKLLYGAADMTDCFRTASFAENPVLQFTAVCHLAERKQNCTIRVLSTWGQRLEGLGLWYDQLLSESLGKNEVGATPITVVNTRDLHSRGQQHQEGVRDKLITNLIVERPSTEPIVLPNRPDDCDQLNRLSGKTVPDLMSAAIAGTNKAYADVGRPTADIILPKLDEYCLGQLLQMLMLATVVEGQLIGVNPYGQPGVEAYKANTMHILTRRKEG